MNNYPFYPSNDDSPEFDSFPDPYTSQFMPTPSTRPFPPPPGGPPQHGGPMPFPPGGPPHGGPMPFPPGGPPHGGHPGEHTPMPLGPPPQFTPAAPSWHQGSRGIRSCLFRNTFIWMNDRSSFWFFPTFVLGNIVYGYRWGRFGWIFHLINGNNIRSFQCF